MKRIQFRNGKIKKAAVPLVRGLEAMREARQARLLPDPGPGDTAGADWGIYRPAQKEAF